MSKQFKAFLAQVAPLHKAIKAEHLTAADHMADHEASLAKIVELQAELSVIEHEAADAGITANDLHAAVKF